MEASGIAVIVLLCIVCVALVVYIMRLRSYVAELVSANKRFATQQEAAKQVRSVAQVAAQQEVAAQQRLAARQLADTKVKPAALPTKEENDEAREQFFR